MKSLSFLIIALFASLTAMAQGVNFEPDGTTLEQAAAKAKKEGKLVFMDCYTQWCGPCKSMAKKVFPNDTVGQYMNPKFVSIKVDMETAYGAPLAKKLQVTAYPTFVIFNADAQEIGRFLGASDVQGLIARVKEKSVDNGSSALEARWNQGDRDQAFLMEYLGTLTATYKNQQASEVADAILAGKESTFASDSTLRMIYMRSVQSPFSPAFIYTSKHPEALMVAIGEMPVVMKQKSVLTNAQREFIVEGDGTATLDQAKFDKFVALLAELGIQDADHYRLSTLITLSEKQKDLTSYIKYIEEYLANPALDADDMTLARWVKPFSAPGADEVSKAKMAAILEQRIADIESGKRKAQTKIGNMTMSRPTDELLRMIVGTLKTGQLPNQ